jgi:DNA-binding CsgD family transcriptional regulator
MHANAIGDSMSAHQDSGQHAASSPPGAGGVQAGIALTRQWSPEFFEKQAAAIMLNRSDLAKGLSKAQQNVLGLLLQGKSEIEIADSLGRSRHTVHDHIKAIYRRLGVTTRVQLLLLFISPMGVGPS